jgi:hypothetical protein
LSQSKEFAHAPTVKILFLKEINAFAQSTRPSGMANIVQDAHQEWISTWIWEFVMSAQKALFVDTKQ